SRCMIATGPGSKYKASLKLEARQRMNRGVEVGSPGHNATFLDEEMRTRGISATDDRHESPPLTQLVEKRIRDIFHASLQNDQVIRCLVCMAGFEIANHDRGIATIELSQCGG